MYILIVNVLKFLNILSLMRIINNYFFGFEEIFNNLIGISNK